MRFFNLILGDVTYDSVVGIKPEKLDGRIEFRDVSFSYPVCSVVVENQN